MLFYQTFLTYRLCSPFSTTTQQYRKLRAGSLLPRHAHRPTYGRWNVLYAVYADLSTNVAIAMAVVVAVAVAVVVLSCDPGRCRDCVHDCFRGLFHVRDCHGGGCGCGCGCECVAVDRGYVRSRFQDNSKGRGMGPLTGATP